MASIDELIAKYQLKELRVVLTRFDEKLVSSNKVHNFIEKNINNHITRLPVINFTYNAYYNHNFSPFIVDGSGNPCDICKMKYAEKKRLFDHVKMSLMDSFYRCEICNMALPPQNPYITIDLEKDWSKRKKCEVCSVLF